MSLFHVKNVLVLAAHPDDEVLGCGGTINRLSNGGCNVTLLTFTNGEGARNNGKDRTILTPSVCKILGINNYHSFYFPDNEMDSVPLLKICKCIENCVRGKEYNLVLTHHPQCLNVDHRVVHQATITAFRPSFQQPLILSYYIPSSSDYTNVAAPNFFVTLEENEMEAKCEAMKVYNSEVMKSPHSRSIENIINVAKVHGATNTSNYAEAFYFNRAVI